MDPARPGGGCPGIAGKALYEGLRNRGILVRYFEKPRINDFVRITIGNAEECAALADAAEEIAKEQL